MKYLKKKELRAQVIYFYVTTLQDKGG